MRYLVQYRKLSFFKILFISHPEPTTWFQDFRKIVSSACKVRFWESYTKHNENQTPLKMQEMA